MTTKEMKDRIEALKKERDAIILAHYYVPDDVQEVADYVGDSYGLAKLAKSATQKTICFAGVKFMSESAKILNPEKTVLVPEMNADCAMAHMITPEEITKVREAYEDLAVVCYINSTAEIKKYADVIVTSSNALKIVGRLKEKNIFFIPDQHLGRFISKQLPEKHFIYHTGYCPVHAALTKEDVAAAKKRHPNAKLLAHPECPEEVLAEADYIGSTSGIIEYAAENKEPSYVIATELGVLHELRKQCPNTEFFGVKDCQACEDMKMVTLEKVLKSLETMAPTMEFDDAFGRAANAPLLKMLELAK